MPFATINSKKLFYTDFGPTSTSPSTTLFLHGLGSSSCFYATIIPSLQETTRCIAIDYPGSGLSELGDEELSLDSLARDVIDLLKGLEIQENINLVGHSMGGLLASHLASTNPSLFSAIALLGPVDPAPTLASVFEKRIETIRSSGSLEVLADSIPSAATGSKSSSLHHAFIRSLILGTSQEGYVALCNLIASADRPEYGEIKIPLLMLVGEDDKTSPLAGCEAILRAYGTGGAEEGEMGGREDKRLVVLKGVGHWHCVEDGEGVMRHLKGFLESVS
ncbi:putative alpha/beta hydrolase [Mollisia scopiformis]|uniref:Putative alpha/beta hydrolase n=1 Tax=Mollisia scopiformis TaxID=149040 RepID=A0A194X988_MOLSC|nr:putative alpha/beta hydrolase [Mollisia scopiformis]KUJ16733.1 putative alpha/beta hydrolase [Mollisia scopiformis]